MVVYNLTWRVCTKRFRDNKDSLKSCRFYSYLVYNVSQFFKRYWLKMNYEDENDIKQKKINHVRMHKVSQKFWKC
jgi:hypothetical protein